jgi:hypothetical protein
VFGPLEIHDFSYGFRMWPRSPDTGSDGVYVKMPRHELLFEREQPLFPRTDTDRATGREEYDSLRFLERALVSSELDSVRPLAFLDQHGAVVTRLVSGQDVFVKLRHWDRSSSPKPLLDVMYTAGEGVRKYHEATPPKIGEFSPAHETPKLTEYLDDLANRGVARRKVERWKDRIQSTSVDRFPVRMVRTLKGLDLRNLIWTDDGRIVLLDPGKQKDGPAEADLARFLLTYRILYWGGLWFPLGRKPTTLGEEAFLDGYGRTPGSRCLDWFILKEVLKHWHMARVAVAIKSWPEMSKRGVEAIYVDPFYARELERGLTALEGG